MKRDFNSWLNTFRSSIASYQYYVDFEKVYKKKKGKEKHIFPFLQKHGGLLPAVFSNSEKM